jgi:alkylation response protein AidB-like acyl-CoA dehydrogenase
MAFFQDPPRLGNQFDDDACLREYLARTLPAESHRVIADELREVGALAGALHPRVVAERLIEPVHTPFDPWGNRVDHIEVSPLWKDAAVLSARHGLVAAGYEDRHGEHRRVHQHALVYVLAPSLDIYSCPLAMTDGAVRTLLDHGNRALIDRAVGRLISRDPAVAWTSGQWMTERTGGSDVGTSETVARQVDGEWRLYGTKWFTSAPITDVALTLGRPEGNGPGGRGLALFYLELRDEHGRLRNMLLHRLKDKLGTRKVPTGEIELEGTPAVPVIGLDNGVRAITPMLNITRTWNAICAASGMRRACALAVDFAGRRQAFGARLRDKPLHVDTLAWMLAETDGATLLSFRVAELMGAREAGRAGERDERLLRALTPIVKLTTGKQAVAVASEALECFGGAGYVEDTGLPRLLRDAQVLPIWEGTTNVLSLDLLRALARDESLDAITAEINERLGRATDGSLAAPVATARRALAHAGEWLMATLADPVRLEAGARRFALTVGRTLELALLADHAQWCLTSGRGPRAAAAARRLAAAGIDQITDLDPGDAGALLA